MLTLAKNEFFRPRIDLKEFESNIDLDHDLKVLFQTQLNEPLNDITIDAFIRKRFDDSFADYLFDPLCRGITSGDSRLLSIRSMFASILEAERRSGSVVKGMLTDMLSRGKPQPQNTSKLVQDLKRNKATLWGLRDGMSQLPRTIEAHLNDSAKSDGMIELHLNSQVKSIKFESDNSVILNVASTSGTDIEITASHVFSTIPSYALSSLLNESGPLHPPIEKLKYWLNSIPFASVAVINLEFEGSSLLNQYAGFGFLVPSFVDSNFLGIAFDSVVFPEHNASNKTTRISVSLKDNRIFWNNQ